MRSTVAPWNAAVTAASSATGRSEVPAQTTATRPGSGSTGAHGDRDAARGSRGSARRRAARRAGPRSTSAAVRVTSTFWPRAAMRSTMAATCSGVLPAPKTTSGKPRRRRAVVVDLREAEVLEGQGAQPLGGLLGRDAPVLDACGADRASLRDPFGTLAGRLTSSTAWINYEFSCAVAHNAPQDRRGMMAIRCGGLVRASSSSRPCSRARESRGCLAEEVASRSHEPTRIRHPWTLLPDPRHPGRLRAPPLHHGLPVLPAPRPARAAGAAAGAPARASRSSCPSTTRCTWWTACSSRVTAHPLPEGAARDPGPRRLHRRDARPSPPPRSSATASRASTSTTSTAPDRDGLQGGRARRRASRSRRASSS